jgi:hypothetical protein
MTDQTKATDPAPIPGLEVRSDVSRETSLYLRSPVTATDLRRLRHLGVAWALELADRLEAFGGES